MGKQKNRFKFDSVNVLNFIWIKRKLLLWVALIAIIISTIFSYRIKPKFKSTVLMFPVTSASVSRSIFNSAFARDDLIKFGNQEDGEQLMQILLSSQIRDMVAKDFNLAKHYGINTNDKYWKTNLIGEYKENISFRRTEFMSVVIEVLDHNPDTAALIANDISNLVDSVVNHAQNERTLKSLNAVNLEYSNVQKRMAGLEDSINFINNAGLVGYDGNAIAYHKAYAKAIAEGKTAGIKTLENKLKLISKYAVTYNKLNNLLSIETQKLRELRETYLEAKVEAEHIMPHKFVIDKAYPSDKKDSPKRMMIILFSTLSAMFFALLKAAVQEKISYNND